eukprot:578204-Amphidinium_carterae.1
MKTLKAIDAYAPRCHTESTEQSHIFEGFTRTLQQDELSIAPLTLRVLLTDPRLSMELRVRASEPARTSAHGTGPHG